MATSSVDGKKYKPKLSKFSEVSDTMDSYLIRFERVAKLHSWSRDEWASTLGTQLTGKALDVYSRMSDEDANDYEKLKEALLIRYEYTEDGFKERF